MIINNKRGSSLIETVVTCCILGALSSGMVTILKVNATETSEGIVNSRLQMQYENVVEQLSRDIRKSSCVLDQGNGETFDQLLHLIQEVSSNEIMLYDNSGNQIAGYWIDNNNILMEFDAVNRIWVPYKIGPNKVTLAENSSFKLDSGRKSVDLALSFSLSYKNANGQFKSESNIISCRN